MKRPVMEVALVVAISVFTVSTTATVLHDLSAGKPDRVQLWFTAHVSPMFNRWFSSTVAPDTKAHAAGNSRPTGSFSPSSLPTPMAFHTGEGFQLIGGASSFSQSGAPAVPNQADFTRLRNIEGNFVASMTQADFARLVQALNSSGRKSDVLIKQVINDHIPPNDRRWLAQTFSGSAPFSDEDVSLLRQSFQQALQVLTPAERSTAIKDIQAWLRSVLKN